MDKIKYLYYLASPYAHIDSSIMYKRKEVVCNICLKLLEADLAVISPIAHNTTLLEESNTTNKGWDFWKPFNTKLLEGCDGIIVLMLNGWKDSVGVTDAILRAGELRMPIHYIEEEGTEAWR